MKCCESIVIWNLKTPTKQNKNENINSCSSVHMYRFFFINVSHHLPKKTHTLTQTYSNTHTHYWNCWGESSWKSTVSLWLVSGCILQEAISRHSSAHPYWRTSIWMWDLFQTILTKVHAKYSQTNPHRSVTDSSFIICFMCICHYFSIVPTAIPKIF